MDKIDRKDKFMYLGRQMRRPPEVSALLPCWSWNMLPQALPTAAILAITGRLWITNPTWSEKNDNAYYEHYTMLEYT